MYYLPIIIPMAYGIGRNWEVGNPGEKKDCRKEPGREIVLGIWNEMDAWYLNTGNQPCGRI